jgi:poly(A) polymerase Pap1
LARYLGVTPPISTAPSTDREREVTVTLMEELRRQNVFESEEESRNRCVLPDTQCERVHILTTTAWAESWSLAASPSS